MAGVIRGKVGPQILSGHPDVAAIEADRKRLGIRLSALVIAAGLRPHHYARLRLARRPRPATIARLRRALKALAANAGPGVSDQAEQTLAVYRAFVAGLSPFFGVTVDEVEAAAPQRGATADEGWRRCRQCAQAAIYLVVVNFQIPQRRLAGMLGLTPAAVCLALQAVEDRRDDAAFERALTEVQRTITRRAA